MFIYRIKNKKNGKIYIGQTTRTIEERFRNHCNNNSKSAIASAINKYGKDSFEIEELAKADNQYQLDQLEAFYININKSLAPNGYNLKTGGSNGVIYSKKSKKKMSEAKLGTSISKQTKQKMSNAHKDRWNDDDGTLSSERSIIVKRAWECEEYREKISKARKEYWSNEDNRENASKRGKNMAADLDYISKVSEGVKKALAKPETKAKLAKFHDKQKKQIIDSNGVVYDSIKSAAQKLNVMPSNIVKVLKGVYKKTKGLSFKYHTQKRTKREINMDLDKIYKEKKANPDLSQQTIYIVSGIAGSGKSWVCNKLKNDPRFHYVSYDENRKSNHLDLIRSAPKDKIVLYDLNIKTSTFIRRNCEEFNIRFVTILGDFLQVKVQLKERGGKITKGAYSRWGVMKKRAATYGEFSGSSSEILKYLKNL